MKHLIPLMLLLVPWPVLAGEPSVKVAGFGEQQAAVADAITINGPDRAKSGDTVTCTLAGTPTVDLAKPLLDQLGWLMGDDRMFVFVAMPGQPMVPLDVEGTIVFGAGGATMRPQVAFPCGQPGEYRVVVDWNFGQNHLVEHIVAVEGDVDPFPDPKPDPDPLPPPPGQRLVLILSESANRTPQEVATTQALRRHLESQTSGPTFRLLDPSQTPEWSKPLVAEINKRQVAPPVLAAVVLPTDTNAAPFLAGVETLPGRTQEAIAFVEEALK